MTQPPAKAAPAAPAPAKVPEPAASAHDPQAEKLRAAKVEGAVAEPPVRTIGDEQRARSAEIEAMGTDAWVKAHDERDPDAKQKAVAGVQHRPVEAHEARR
jgi:hypothetical protein